MGKASQLKIHQHQAAGQYARDGGHFGLLRHQEDHANSGRGKYMIFFFVAALSASAKMLAAQRSSISALVRARRLRPAGDQIERFSAVREGLIRTRAARATVEGKNGNFTAPLAIGATGDRALPPFL